MGICCLYYIPPWGICQPFPVFSSSHLTFSGKPHTIYYDRDEIAGVAPNLRHREARLWLQARCGRPSEDSDRAGMETSAAHSRNSECERASFRMLNLGGTTKQYALVPKQGTRAFFCPHITENQEISSHKGAIHHG